MIRKMIEIDEAKCNGCGLCAEACHEGAIGIINGKAKLLRDDFCDGLGDCLPVCPAGAITFVEREAAAYDEMAVMKQKKRKMQATERQIPCGCPGQQARSLKRMEPPSEYTAAGGTSQLRQWPVQIKRAPVNASYFNGAHLLIAADCAAYAYGSFHQDFMRGKITLIGCPKLDHCDYSEKLTDIIRQNEIQSLTVIRMEVPCCGGIEHAAVTALKNSGKYIPWQVVTISTDGRRLDPHN